MSEGRNVDIPPKHRYPYEDQENATLSLPLYSSTPDPNETSDSNHAAFWEKENRDSTHPGTRIQEKIPFNVLESIDWKDSNTKKSFLLNPCPIGTTVEFYIQRHRGIHNRFLPEYRVYLKHGNVFLMSSRKRPNNRTSNYLISMSKSDSEKGSSNILGKLRANFWGTEYQIYDAGRNRNRHDPFQEDVTKDDPIRMELGAILYDSTWFGEKGPRKMQVCINNVDHVHPKSSTKKIWQPTCKEEEMIRCFQQRSTLAMRHLHVFVNRLPQYGEDQRSYLQNFHGRVTQVSVKNFQLIGEHDERMVMQFGRVDKDEFTMDVRWPFSPLQAFAVALSACDKKIACGD